MQGDGTPGLRINVVVFLQDRVEDDAQEFVQVGLLEIECYTVVGCIRIGPATAGRLDEGAASKHYGWLL